MTLYETPTPVEPPRSLSKGKYVLDAAAKALSDNPGKWFAIGESKSHNGIGTYKQRLAAMVPGVELVGRKNDDGNVVLYARAPEVTS